MNYINNLFCKKFITGRIQISFVIPSPRAKSVVYIGVFTCRLPFCIHTYTIIYLKMFHLNSHK